MKKAICFALYGTKDPKAKERWKTTEIRLQELYAPVPVHFLSLSEDNGRQLSTALEKETTEELEIISLLLENGRTYRKLEETAALLAKTGIHISVTPPLLETKGALEAIASSVSGEGNQTLLVLHGQPGREDKAATELNRILPPSVRAISLEGTPDLQETISHWKQKEIEVYPLMVQGGTHLQEDILGFNRDSLFFRLSTMSFRPTLREEAFGESPLFFRLLQMASEEKL